MGAGECMALLGAWKAGLFQDEGSAAADGLHLTGKGAEGQGWWGQCVEAPDPAIEATADARNANPSMLAPAHLPSFRRCPAASRRCCRTTKAVFGWSHHLRKRPRCERVRCRRLVLQKKQQASCHPKWHVGLSACTPARLQITHNHRPS